MDTVQRESDSLRTVNTFVTPVLVRTIAMEPVVGLHTTTTAMIHSPTEHHQSLPFCHTNQVRREIVSVSQADVSPHLE